MTATFDPARYWDDRYASGGDSGIGSCGINARRKAAVVNRIAGDYKIGGIVDWGCGDGQVLTHIDLDAVDYTGVDISRTAIRWLAAGFPDLRFVHTDDAGGIRADLALSLDVLFHLPDDGDYRAHLAQVFTSARRLVLVHATDHDGGRTARHVRWRRWTPDIPDGWTLVERPADPAVTGFFLCERTP